MQTKVTMDKNAETIHCISSKVEEIQAGINGWMKEAKFTSATSQRKNRGDADANRS